MNDHDESQQFYAIRPAGPADVPQVILLDAELTGLAKPEYWASVFARHSGPGSHFLAAVEGERLLGFIIGEIRAWEFGSPPCGWVFAIGIAAGHRQQGVGRALFEAVCARFKTDGVATVRTMLARDNALVMSFFRSQGMMAGPFVQLERDL